MNASIEKPTGRRYGRPAERLDINIMVKVTRAEKEALERVAAAQERSMSWIGRRLICDFLATEADEEA